MTKEKEQKEETQTEATEQEATSLDEAKKTETTVEESAQETTVPPVDWESRYKGLQRTLNKQNRKLRKFESKGQTTTPQVDGLEAVTEAWRDGDWDKAQSVIGDMKRTQQMANQYEEQRQIIDNKRDEFEALIEKSEESPDDAKFDDVWESFELAAAQTGNFNFAERKLSRILKTPNNPKPKEKTVTELTDDERAEIARQWQEEQGILTTHVSNPSGGSKSDMETIEAYGRGDATEEQYLQAKKNLGI